MHRLNITIKNMSYNTCTPLQKKGVEALKHQHPQLRHWSMLLWHLHTPLYHPPAPALHTTLELLQNTVTGSAVLKHMLWSDMFFCLALN